MADGVAIAVAAVPEVYRWWHPLSQLAAAQRLTARGALVRSPREALGRVDTICFSKTGTLTGTACGWYARYRAAPQPGGIRCRRPPMRLRRGAAGRRPRATQPHNGEGHAHATDEAIAAASALAIRLVAKAFRWVVLWPKYR